MTHIRTQINALTTLADIYADTLSHMNRGQITSSLLKEGFKLLGRGIFSAVLVHPVYPDVVIKVGQRKSGRRYCDSYTDGFPEYVTFLQSTRTQSKFALKVYHHREVNSNMGGTYVTVSERCYPGKGTQAQKSVTAASNVVKGHTWCAEGADGHAVRFIKYLKRGTPSKHRIDLHSGNIMLRRDGTPVITDPLC